MKTALLIAAVVIALGAMWIFGGRQIVLALDSIATADHVAPGSTPPIVAGSGWLNVGETPLQLAPDGESATIHIDGEAGAPVVLHSEGADFTLGTGSQADASSAAPYDVAVVPDPGDTVTYAVTHSVMAWPTPLDLNFMTGNSPSWKRNVYYTLTWRKQSGAELKMVWRYEQWFYDDWASATMINTGTTGLIQTDIRRAS